MAVSLLRRGFQISQTSKLYASLFPSNPRLFSSDKDKNDNSTDLIQKSDEKLNVDHQNNSESLPGDSSNSNVDGKGSQIISGMSPSEGAVDKFFQIVQRVKKSQDMKESSDLVESEAVPNEDLNESFSTMLRKSKLVSLGDISSGRQVEGKVIEVMEDDLYIDFGGKFHCVCPRPKRNPGLYHRGTKVLVNVKALEMSSAFLGSDIHVTLLEADGTLLGLADSRSQRITKTRN